MIEIAAIISAEHPEPISTIPSCIVSKEALSDLGQGSQIILTKHLIQTRIELPDQLALSYRFEEKHSEAVDSAWPEFRIDHQHAVILWLLIDRESEHGMRIYATTNRAAMMSINPPR